MKGKYGFKVRNNKIAYDFTIKRNITIIKGNSATGKTTLLQMLDAWVRLGSESGIYVNTNAKFRVFMTEDGIHTWQSQLRECEETVVFIEEGNYFVQTKEFARIIAETGCYVVLVTRIALPNLPYSITEIYEIREKGRYGSMHQVFNCLQRL